MSKAYWIVNVKVAKPDSYKKYKDLAGPAVSQYGGIFLVRGGNQHIAEGSCQGERSVIIEFSSMEQAIACYQSSAYQEARATRRGAAEFHCLIVEGTTLEEDAAVGAT